MYSARRFVRHLSRHEVEAGSLTAPGRGRMAARPRRAPGSPWKDVSASVTAGMAPAAEATRPHVCRAGLLKVSRLTGQ